MGKKLDQNNKVLNNEGNEFNEVEQQANEFGDEIKKATDMAEDAGVRFEKLGGMVKGIGVAMTLTDMTVGAAAYADEILTTATVTGMSTESLQAYKYDSELVDVSMETLTGSMAKQVKSMSSARDGSKSMSEAYKKLDVSVVGNNG